MLSVAALPSPADRERARLYDWEDIASLQELLLESVNSMLDSDTTVAALRTKFEDALRQKREVGAALRVMRAAACGASVRGRRRCCCTLLTCAATAVPAGARAALQQVAGAAFVPGA
jgi:hypothetical protein